jgi:hypothetical protein
MWPLVETSAARIRSPNASGLLMDVVESVELDRASEKDDGDRKL